MSRCLQFPPPGYKLPSGYILEDGYIVPPGYILKEIKGFKKVVKKHKNEETKRKKKRDHDRRSNKEHSRIKRIRKDESCVTMELDEAQATLTSQSSTGNSYSTPAIEATRDHALRVCQDKTTDPISSVGIISKHSKEIKEKKIPSSSSLCRRCPPSVAMNYLNLVENWTPPDVVERKLIDSEEDQEWWMVTKIGTKRDNEISSNERISEGSSSMMWPSARYLPEAQVYALPFTVPF